MIEKIVSGGQTGADRAALDVARELGIATGGWVPRGRRSEDGAIPERYVGLVETDSEAYEPRTERNVRDSDATLILAFGEPRGGTQLAHQLALRFDKPVLTLDLQLSTIQEAIASVRDWFARTQPRILNVAGPRLSEEPRISHATSDVLREALRGAAAFYEGESVKPSSSDEASGD